MSATAPAQRLTEIEFLEFERQADVKHEFFEGEVFAMAGGTPAHSLIATNLAGELRSKLKGKPCRPYNSGLRLKIEATGLLTYPDVSVICDPLRFAPGTNDTVINPVALFEVLSDSTEAYDRGNKFLSYQRVPSLREYVLLSQQEARVELFAPCWSVMLDSAPL
jgi:Uma2 family endonuclease